MGRLWVAHIHATCTHLWNVYAPSGCSSTITMHFPIMPAQLIAFFACVRRFTYLPFVRHCCRCCDTPAPFAVYQCLCRLLFSPCNTLQYELLPLVINHSSALPYSKCCGKCYTMPGTAVHAQDIVHYIRTRCKEVMPRQGTRKRDGKKRCRWLNCYCMGRVLGTVSNCSFFFGHLEEGNTTWDIIIVA